MKASKFILIPLGIIFAVILVLNYGDVSGVVIPPNPSNPGSYVFHEAGDLAPLADDTLGPLSLDIPAGSKGGKSQYTMLNWSFLIYTALPGSADTIAGYVVLQVKNNALWNSSVKDSAGLNWYDYDSCSVSGTGVIQRDSVMNFAKSSLPFGSLHFPLPPADSVRWILRTVAESDSISYWRVDAKLSGNSRLASNCLEGSYHRNKIIVPAGDDTVPTIQSFRRYQGIEEQGYEWLCFWWKAFSKNATSDSIFGNLIFEVARVDTAGKWIGWHDAFLYGPDSVALTDSRDSVTIVKAIRMPFLPPEWRMRFESDATSDSIRDIKFIWRWVK